MFESLCMLLGWLFFVAVIGGRYVYAKRTEREIALGTDDDDRLRLEGERMRLDYESTTRMLGEGK